MKLLSLIVSLAVTLGAHAACAAQNSVSTYTEEAPSVSSFTECTKLETGGLFPCGASW